MKEMKTNIEDDIREKLRAYEVSPSEDLWSRLEKHLDEKPMAPNKGFSKMKIYIPMMAAAILLLFGIGFLIVPSNESEQLLLPQTTQKTVWQNQELPTQDYAIPSVKKENTASQSVQKQEIANIQEVAPISEEKSDNLSEITEKEKPRIPDFTEEEKQIATAEKTEIKVNSRKLLMSAQYERIQEEQTTKLDRIGNKYREIKVLVQNINN